MCGFCGFEMGNCTVYFPYQLPFMGSCKISLWMQFDNITILRNLHLFVFFISVALAFNLQTPMLLVKWPNCSSRIRISMFLLSNAMVKTLFWNESPCMVTSYLRNEAELPSGVFKVEIQIGTGSRGLNQNLQTGMQN